MLSKDSTRLVHSYGMLTTLLRTPDIFAAQALPSHSASLFAAVDTAPDIAARTASLWKLFALQCDTEHIEAIETLQQLESLPPRTDDDLVRKATGRLQVAFRFGNVASAREPAKAAWHMIDCASNPLTRTSFCNAYGAILYGGGWYDEALEVAEREFNDGRTYGLTFVEDHARALRCAAELGLRHFASAQREANRMLDGESDDPHIAAYAHGVLARILIFQGRQDEAIHVLATAPNAGLTTTVAELCRTERLPRLRKARPMMRCAMSQKQRSSADRTR